MLWLLGGARDGAVQLLWQPRPHGHKQCAVWNQRVDQALPAVATPAVPAAVSASSVSAAALSAQPTWVPGGAVHSSRRRGNHRCERRRVSRMEGRTLPNIRHGGASLSRRPARCVLPERLLLWQLGWQLHRAHVSVGRRRNRDQSVRPGPRRRKRGLSLHHAAAKPASEPPTAITAAVTAASLSAAVAAALVAAASHDPRHALLHGAGAHFRWHHGRDVSALSRRLLPRRGVR